MHVSSLAKTTYTVVDQSFPVGYEGGVDHICRKQQFLLFPLNCHYTHTGVLASADERHGNPPQGNQELLVIREKVGRPQVSLG